VFADLHVGASHLAQAPTFARKAIRSALMRARNHVGRGADGGAVVSWRPERIEPIGLEL
jgi:hypothetical protein